MKYIPMLLPALFLSFHFSKKDEIKKTSYSDYHIQAKKYCKKNNLNTDFYILIDLGIHSGKKRFFVYDFKEEKVVSKYIVSHGCGKSVWSAATTKEDATISNEIDSHASSIGKYIVASRGASQWGIKVNYRLVGKDKTNSNAEKRAIVLHSWDDIQQEEIYPKGTPEGWGCPAINNEDMKELDKKLTQSKKKKLMWIIKN
jgi:hypothetical protein